MGLWTTQPILKCSAQNEFNTNGAIVQLVQRQLKHASKINKILLALTYYGPNQPDG